MLEVKNVTVKYGDFTAVKDLNFTIKPGEIFGLLGSNGAGKTTTFRLIMGLLEPFNGEVLYNGKKISYDDVNEIGYMIEERSLFTKMKVKDVILFFGRLKDLSPELVLERLDYWLERFKITEYKEKKIKELSKGNQQKIQFISAIINEPKLLILDEPFSGLDPINTQLFSEVIMEFKDKGTMIVFSSHRVDHVERICKKLLLIEKGEELLSGNISDIKTDFRRHNIRIVGKVDEAKIKEIPGVLKVERDELEVIVKIDNHDSSKNVFEYIKTLDNIEKYEIEQATLSEIFIAKVGQSYEEV
ncbi:MAG TPA: ATP-binding cassette domain-containing protein [Acholeplasmataceae bacterium]|nr:ATP-binding cassette domain-containing protein [Acholeplasmataceae bacterium]